MSGTQGVKWVELYPVNALSSERAGHMHLSFYKKRQILKTFTQNSYWFLNRWEILELSVNLPVYYS